MKANIGDKIELSLAEISLASYHGQQRQCAAIKNKRKSLHSNTERYSWENHLEGAIGECALSSYRGLYWTGVRGRNEPDVGGIFDVRTTSYHNGDLAVYDKDPDDRFMWLLTGYNGTYIVRGGIHAWEAKEGRKNWCSKKDNGHYAHWVKQDQLYIPEGYK